MCESMDSGQRIIDEVVQQMVDVVERGSGPPFTDEQVKEWCRQGRRVMRESLTSASVPGDRHNDLCDQFTFQFLTLLAVREFGLPENLGKLDD